jgi:hypothetical protein
VGYTTALWLSFGEALAAVAGALTGLLFVAVSVKSDALAASHSLSSRAAQTLVLFMTSVFTALFLVTPQPRRWPVLADPRRRSKPPWRRSQRLAVPHQGDQLVLSASARELAHWRPPIVKVRSGRPRSLGEWPGRVGSFIVGQRPSPWTAAGGR